MTKEQSRQIKAENWTVPTARLAKTKPNGEIFVQFSTDMEISDEIKRTLMTNSTAAIEALAENRKPAITVLLMDFDQEEPSENLIAWNVTSLESRGMKIEL